MFPKIRRDGARESAILRALLAAGYTQRDLARYLGMSQSYVSRKSRGEGVRGLRSPGARRKLHALARRNNITV